MKLDKIAKELGQDTLDTINAYDLYKLKDTIAYSEQAILHTTNERNANPHYVAAKLAVKDLSEGLKEVKKRQTAIIQYCLRRIQELNGVQLGDEE